MRTRIGPSSRSPNPASCLPWTEAGPLVASIPGQPARPWRRIAAFAADYVAIAAYVALLTGAGLALRDADPVARLFARSAAAHAIGFLVLTLPVILYFVAFECSAMRATPGKRLAGLVVATTNGGRPGFSRALGRSALKFLPWELSHTLLWRIPRGPEAEGPLPSWIVAGFALVWLLVLIYLVGLFRRDRRTLYDRLTGTIVRSEPAKPFA